MRRSLLSFDLWSGDRSEIATRQPRAGCSVCGEREFTHLAGIGRPHITLCGRNSVQIHEHHRPIDLAAMHQRLAAHGDIQAVRSNDLLLAFRAAAAYTYPLCRWPRYYSGDDRRHHRSIALCPIHRFLIVLSSDLALQASSFLRRSRGAQPHSPNLHLTQVATVNQRACPAFRPISGQSKEGLDRLMQETTHLDAFPKNAASTAAPAEDRTQASSNAILRLPAKRRRSSAPRPATQTHFPSCTPCTSAGFTRSACACSATSPRPRT